MRTSTDPEEEPLALLTDIRDGLTHAVNSLGGVTPTCIEHRYYFNAAKHIHRATDGFILLRKQRCVDASKNLIRPAIEPMLRIQALRRHPELIYRIGYSEMLEIRKWIRPAALRLGAQYDEQTHELAWPEFEEGCRREYPDAQLTKQQLTVFDAAKAAGLVDYFDTVYRMYCKYTHAALIAIGGNLDEFADPLDTRVMITCAFTALNAISEIGAMTTRLQNLNARVTVLMKKEPEKLIRQVLS